MACLLLAMMVSTVSAEPEEVVVVGISTRKLVDHVAGIVSVNRENQLARWNSSLCLRIEGLPSTQHAIIRERLADASDKVRLSLLAEGCAHNVLLFFAANAADVSQRLAQHFEVPLRQDSTARVQAFMATTAPIRWINTYDRCGFGCRLANSRITASSAPSVDFMLLIVDTTQIEGRRLQDIADYIAFVILANPSPTARPQLSSVLSLFSAAPNRTAIGGMSQYDRAYLEALYSVPMDRYVENQRNALGSTMLSRLNSMLQ